MNMSFFNLFKESWICQDAFVILLLLILGTIVYQLSKREYWQLAYREVRSRPAAVICFFILMVYAGIAILDSVGWSYPVRDAETGEIVRHSETGHILWDKGHSALDYMLTPLRERKEKTYSAPFAKTGLMKESILNAEGKVVRDYPPLNHPKKHWLGTDRVGIDVLYQNLKSIRTAMIIGLLTTLLALPFAIIMGTCAGYFGGWIDDVIQYVYTVMSSIPFVLFIAAFMIVAGQGLFQLCLAMGIASWTGLCRLLRGETMKLREMEYVQAAVSIGVPSRSILTRHIIPNVLHLVLISAILGFSANVLAEATLTYLGIGVGADVMSWGAMINDARTELTRSPIIWWKLVSAFIFMVGLVLPANIFGDAVRDALDPRLRTQ